MKEEEDFDDLPDTFGQIDFEAIENWIAQSAGRMGLGVRGGKTMEFIIKRTSDWYNKQPCEEARKKKIVNIDRRGVDDPKKIPAFNGTDGDWYERGTNHRIEDGRIARDMGMKTVWTIEISTLDELMALHEKHGNLVIQSTEDGVELEIYDDYRE